MSRRTRTADAPIADAPIVSPDPEIAAATNPDLSDVIDMLALATDELATLTAERDAAKGRARATLTRRVNATTADVDALTVQLATARAATKKFARNAKFDSPAIVAACNSGSITTAAELAATLNLPLDGRLRRRLNWLANRDHLIPVSFTD